MLPFDSEHLTPVEMATERMMRKPNCWSCLHLKRHPRGGYSGCEEGIDIQPVIAGENQCEEWIKR